MSHSIGSLFGEWSWLTLDPSYLFSRQVPGSITSRAGLVRCQWQFLCVCVCVCVCTHVCPGLGARGPEFKPNSDNFSI